MDGNGNSLWTSVGAKSVPVAFGSGILFSNSTAMMLIDRDGKVKDLHVRGADIERQ